MEAAKQKEEKEKQANRVLKKVLRDATKTLSEYESEAKRTFQKWVRLRDEKHPCISCGTIVSEIWDGGHYLKAELYSGMIFDERNVHKQCRKCNYYLGGNETNYRKGLIERYGWRYVKQLEYDSNGRRDWKFTKQELIAKKLQYDLKIKELKNKL